MTSPISVVIAAKNSAETLPEQLEALIGQHWPDGGEIIVADNGSTDATADVAASYNSADRRVIVLPCGEVPGAGYARNRAVQVATFDRIGFCDADDVVGDLWVEEIGHALDSADAVSGYLDLDRLNSEAAAQSRGSWNTQGLPLLGGEVPVLSSCNLAISRATFESVGGFDTNIERSEDAGLSLRLYEHGAATAFAERAVVHYRMRSSLVEVYKQAYQWGRNEPYLLAQLEGETGASNSSMFRTVRSWAWLVKSVHLLGDEAGRLRYAYVLGKRAGFLSGQLEMREAQSA